MHARSMPCCCGTQVRSPPETAVEVADINGFHTDVLDYSFPQRFADAFANEAQQT